MGDVIVSHHYSHKNKYQKIVHISVKLLNSLYGKIEYPLSQKLSPHEFLIINPFLSYPTIEIACPPWNWSSNKLFQKSHLLVPYTGRPPTHGPFAINACYSFAAFQTFHKITKARINAVLSNYAVQSATNPFN